MVEGVDVGLCLRCRWKRATVNRHGSIFFRCLLAETDSRFVRYPPLPVRSCPGYEEAMLFLVLTQYIKPLADVDAVRADHLAHLERLAAQGVVLAWARRDPPTGGAFLAAAPDRETLERLVAEDPYVKAGVGEPEIVEFKKANVRFAL